MRAIALTIGCANGICFLILTAQIVSTPAPPADATAYAAIASALTSAAALTALAIAGPRRPPGARRTD